MYEPINKNGTKFRACIITNNKPEEGTIYQAVAPENGRLDYLFRVKKLAYDNAGCNRIRSSANYPQSEGGWSNDEPFQPYWVVLEITDLELVGSPNKDSSLLQRRYVPGEYSKDSQLLFVDESNGKFNSIAHVSDAMSEYLSKGGADVVNTESEHYILFDISSKLGYGVIRNNIFVSAGKNGIVGKSHNMNIVDNVFINSRKGDLGLSNYTRGRTVEGPYQFNTIVDNNIFISEKVEESMKFNAVPPIEIISQGWSNIQTISNAEHWDSNLRINKSNDCYNANSQSMIFQKNTKRINDVENCRPLSW